MLWEEFESGGDEHSQRGMRRFMGPHAVDLGIRQAISMCWMALPHERKNVAAVESEIRRLVDRALKHLREDARAFGIDEDHPTDPAES
jgi:hypothetical protein